MRERALTERAEYLTAEDMLSLALIDDRNVFGITDYLTNDLNHTKFYLGAKGLGKTLTAMKSVNNLLKENTEVIPSFILFHALGRPYLLDPLNLATEETWGDRLSFFTEAEPDLGYFLENSDIIILDDLHYMVEAVVQGTLKPELFIHLLETVIQKADEGKKVLLISESPLNVYADELDWRELDVLLPRLGQPPINTDNNNSSRQRWIRSLERTVDYVATREILPLSTEAFCNLCEVYDINIDYKALDILYAIGSRPRNFIKFCNLFGEKEITIFNLIEFTKEKLKTMKRPRGLTLYMYLLDHPEYKFQTPPQVISYIQKKKPTFIVENWYAINSICDIISKEIDEYIEELREIVSSHPHFEVWWTEFLLKFLLTIWNRIKDRIPLDVVNEGQLEIQLRKWEWKWLKRSEQKPSKVWNSDTHYRLLWAERRGFDTYLNKRLKELVEKQYFRGNHDSVIIISHIKDYYRSKTMRRYMETYSLDWFRMDKWDKQAFSAFQVSNYRRIGSNYYAMTPYEYVLGPLIREISTQEIIEIKARQGYSRSLMFDEQLVELHELGLTDREIGENLGVNKVTVGNHRRRLGLKAHGRKGPRRRFTDAQLIELYEKGLNDREIAEKLDVGNATVHNRRKKLGLKAHGRRRLFTDEQLVDLYEQGLNDRKIGERLGISLNTVHYRRRKLGLEPIRKHKL